MSKDKVNIPRANMLMGSMRSMGYSFESAVADIIDNSITAKCQHVYLSFPKTISEPLAVGILDDGEGLTSEELFEAMRYGGTSEAKRKDNDLGRFGLGMKSASMSQCRILTVISRKNAAVCAYRWDYNYILEKQEWVIQELDETDINEIPYSHQLVHAAGSGTLVVWQDFDILEKSNPGQIFSTLCKLKMKVSDYLSLIFHRFLSTNSLRIKIDNYSLKPLDPFLEKHNKTTQKKEVSISNRDSDGVERQIKVKAFILPFITDMSEEDKKNAGGTENFRSLQGFYIYRNQRLIIWGNWFGMKQGLGEITKNARVRVDIPNSLDDIWGIDVMKRSATIPPAILNQLRKTVKDVMETATRQQTHRGRKENTDDEISYIWNRIKGRGDYYYYEINKENILFKYIEEHIPSEYHSYIAKLISEIERNIPTQQIYIDKCNNAVEVEENKNRIEDVFNTGVTIIDSIKEFGRDIRDIIDDILKAEPFCKHTELKEMFNDYYYHDHD
ncbi:MAG: ATP-binding protein [Prevotella sp.]|nr:ATP-binding protein [Prevotella sp.]